MEDETNTTPPPKEEQVRKKPQRATRSALVGKADPVRDLGIFVVILGVLYMVANGFNDIVEKDDPEMVGDSGISPKAKNLKDLRESLQSIMSQHIKDHPPRLDCDLFLEKSSIPGTGLGLFAGKNYSVGEEIIPASQPMWSIGGADGVETTAWEVSPLGLLLKHHPTAANAEPTVPLFRREPPGESFSTTPVLRATRPISVGDEILLNFDQHPHSFAPSLFDNVIPVRSDYDEADELILDARDTFRPTKGRGDKKVPIIANAMLMVQRVVARYRPAVAAILPDTLNNLNKYRGPVDQVTSLYMGMQNQTVPILIRHGRCFSDARTSSSTPSAVTQRKASKADLVHPIPLFLQPASSDAGRQCREEGGGVPSCNQQSGASCWSRPGVAVKVCPLLGPASSVRIVERSADGGSGTGTVGLRWSPWEHAVDPFKKLKVQKKWDGVEQGPAVELVWEMVALDDLGEGDELILALERDASTGGWMIPEDLVLPQWNIA